jgi:hypothetical protein
MTTVNSVVPLTIELAPKMPIFMELTPIRKSQLRHKLPRQQRPQNGLRAGCNWRTARMSLGPTGDPQVETITRPRT